ncbi:hypothetical protein [Aeromonas sp. QDB62]|uniref:hypothetical protein n=1 Tax=Aeromonas sp. QDB62 TaxID=2990499 RepID=UPI0022E6EA8D|nr:hypothetical protein [Aeromonas sp. QDB62]
MHFTKTIFLMLLVVIGLDIYQNTKFGWWLICFAPTLWCWPAIAFVARRPLGLCLLLLCFIAFLVMHWVAALATLCAIVLIWMVKTAKTLPPRPKSRVVIKNYHFW